MHIPFLELAEQVVGVKWPDMSMEDSTMMGKVVYHVSEMVPEISFSEEFTLSEWIQDITFAGKNTSYVVSNILDDVNRAISHSTESIRDLSLRVSAVENAVGTPEGDSGMLGTTVWSSFSEVLAQTTNSLVQQAAESNLRLTQGLNVVQGEKNEIFELVTTDIKTKLDRVALWVDESKLKDQDRELDILEELRKATRRIELLEGKVEEVVVHVQIQNRTFGGSLDVEAWLADQAGNYEVDYGGFWEL